MPLPIEDADKVDARRREMGMMPLAEYMALVNRPKAGTPAGVPKPKG